MRSTRNASKSTPPPKKAVRTPPFKPSEVKKQEEPKVELTTAATEATQDISQKSTVVNGKAKVYEAEAEPTAPVNKAVDHSIQKAELEVHTVRLESDTEVAEVKKEVSLTEFSVSTHEVVSEQVEAEGTPADSEIEEQEEVEELVEEEEEEVEEVEVEVEEDEEEGEGEEEEGLENEDEQNAGLEEEEYNEEDEVEEVEEVEEMEEVEEGDEEDLEEEVEEMEEEEEQGGDGEEELHEQRPVTERQKRKKFEVFVGGLDNNATEEDVKKAFETVGEVMEVRLMTHPQTGKNKGYAFVRFATVDQAKRAATELKRTKIRDKECGVVPSEDNDTLFVGNISKSWKKEQVLDKLKVYGVEGVEEVTLIPDFRNEELNRGYAFVELATHKEAVKAYVRLTKPDSLFGSERSARVAWAEPLLDEEILAKVKSVFVDGVPSSWDEPKVREHFEKFGEIERVVLAKNNPKTKRDDYAFVNYASREAAVACVEAYKSGELVDGDKKVKVKVALSKPVLRKKYVKGTRGAHPFAHPFGGRFPGRGRGWVPTRGSFVARRGRGGRDFFRGGRTGWGEGGGRHPYEPRYIRGTNKHAMYDRHHVEERPSSRPPPRGASVFSRPSRGLSKARPAWHEEDNHVRRPSYDYNSLSSGRGSRGRRGRGGPYRDDYTPRGGRGAPGFGRGRGYPGRHLPREESFPRRPGRGYGYERDFDDGYGSGMASDYAEAGPGLKRPYDDVDEGATYYDASRRGYPRARVDYEDPAPMGGAHYAEPSRPSLGRSSVRSAVQPPVGGSSLSQASMAVYDQPGSNSMYGTGGRGYSSMMSPGTDYSSGAGELRGGSYSSSMYGGARTSSSYGLPGSGSGSYY